MSGVSWRIGGHDPGRDRENASNIHSKLILKKKLIYVVSRGGRSEATGGGEPRTVQERGRAEREAGSPRSRGAVPRRQTQQA